MCTLSPTPTKLPVVSPRIKRQRPLSLRCSTVTHKPPSLKKKLKATSKCISQNWMEYQGIANWEGLLDPLDRNLRDEILRYGAFVEAAYRSFEFDPSSPSFGSCLHPKNKLFDCCGLPETGYRITKNLCATSGVQLPRWTEKAPGWATCQSSWIGYVAVCDDEEQIARLGRRDVVISFRGTATLLEWLENLRATLAPIDPPDGSGSGSGSGPMVESGFLSLYTSRNQNFPSLKEMVRREVLRLIKSYGGEPLSLTVTGHSLGAALATLAAHDVKAAFGDDAPIVTVISFGGPRVGNRSFRRQLEERGTKVLRIVNPDDVITRVPGFAVADDNDVSEDPWAYAEVGTELRLSSKDSLSLGGINVARCHDLKTYLHLVKGLESSTCPHRARANKIFSDTTMVSSTPKHIAVHS